MDNPKRYDVAVIGGGIAGSCAAIACAKEKRSVILVEKNGFLGGALTAGGVGPMSTFYAGDTKIVGGVADEILEEMNRQGFRTYVIGGSGYPYSVCYSAEGLKIALENLCMKYGVSILYHSTLVDVETEDEAIRSCSIFTGLNPEKIEAGIFVDATGDGTLSAMAEVPFVYGNEQDHQAQSSSLLMHLSNVDKQAVIDSGTENKDYVPGDRMVIIGFGEKIEEAQRAGDLNYPRKNLNAFETSNDGEFIINMTVINGLNGADSHDLTKAEIEGRRQGLEIYQFLKKYIPGFRNSVLSKSGPSVGVRETRKIKGLYTLTEQDILSNRSFSDGIALGGYPVDIHDPETGQITVRRLKKGSWYMIPYRCLVTGEYKNLIVAGRCISSTQAANSSLRVSGTLMAVSQAAGVAAAIAGRDGSDVRKICMEDLIRRLRAQNAIIKVYSGD